MILVVISVEEAAWYYVKWERGAERRKEALAG
jgi:hypothetical protein